MSDLYTQFDNIFFEKTRLSIMTIIYREELVSFNQLKETLQMTDGAIYTHLEKLVKADYLDKRKELAGTTVQTVYFLNDRGRELFKSYLKFLESVLQKHKGAE